MDIDPLPTPEIDPLAELPEVTPYGRLWGPPEDVPCPVPEITAADTYAAGWSWWPSPVLALEKLARSLGYDVRIGFARGYKPGRRKNTWELWDTIGAWLDKPTMPRVVFTWERSPDAANTWKAGKASFRGSNGVMVAGHLAGRKML